MKNILKTAKYMVYIALFLGAAWVSTMGYDQVTAARSERALDPTTWLTRQQIDRLMRFHGTDILKVTPDAVFIPRGADWVPVLQRGRD